MKHVLALASTLLLSALESLAIRNCLIRQYKVRMYPTIVNDSCIQECYSIPSLNINDPTCADVESCSKIKDTVQCLKDCPVSEDKTLILDMYSAAIDYCTTASEIEITQAADCLSKNEIMESMDKCDKKCGIHGYWPYAPDMTLRSNGSLCISYNQNRTLVNEQLPHVCKQEDCYLTCVQDKINEICGGTVTGYYLKAHATMIQSVAKAYVDLSVISGMPKVCDFFEQSGEGDLNYVK